MSLRVVSVERGGDGQGHELTDRISGLRFTNVRKGGDESAGFVLHEQWGTSVPEIDKGNLLRIMDGVDVLWQGRVEEADRGGDDDEQIAVTAYGLGARLKDNQVREVYVDQDLGNWGPASRQRKVDELDATTFRFTDPETVDDEENGLPGLVLNNPGALATGQRMRCEAWYDSGDGNLIDAIYFNFEVHSEAGSASAHALVFAVSDTDDLTGSTISVDQYGASSGADYFEPATERRYGAIFWRTTANTTLEKDRIVTVRDLTVYGDHGLTRQGTDPAGFFSSQIIEDAAGRADGITVRRIDDTTFVVRQAEYRDGETSEGVIEDANRFSAHERTWGTWGPDSPLDTSTDGQFDYVEIDSTTQHWLAFREECDDLDLHTELSTLYNQVEVHYADVSGASKVVTRTATVPDLDDAGITRTARLDGGTMTAAAAQTLGDAFLALSGNFAPARGSVTLSHPIRHHERGELPPHYIRADGSNLRLPDILPSETLFELSTTPDRRTTFPIHRVEVDASGDQVQVNVDLDQTNDVLSSLQARLELSAQLAAV